MNIETNVGKVWVDERNFELAYQELGDPRHLQYEGEDHVNEYDVVGQLCSGRVNLGFTAPLLNGHEAIQDGDIVKYMNGPTIETRRKVAEVPKRGESGIVKGLMRTIWEARISDVPDNVLGMRIHLPKVGPWTETLAKTEINKILRGLNQNVQFVGLSGNAELKVLGHPSDAAYLRSVLTHEQSHAEDHFLAMGEALGDWGRRCERVRKMGWTFESFSEKGSREQLAAAIGIKASDLDKATLAELVRNGEEFHNTVKGGPPVFFGATVDESGNIATVKVRNP